MGKCMWKSGGSSREDFCTVMGAGDEREVMREVEFRNYRTISYLWNMFQRKYGMIARDTKDYLQSPSKV